MGMGAAAGGSEIDMFIMQSNLDEGAARSLRAESQEVQMAVMARGDVAECVNPSAAVCGRIRDAKRGGTGGAGMGGAGMGGAGMGGMGGMGGAGMGGAGAMRGMG